MSDPRPQGGRTRGRPGAARAGGRRLRAVVTGGGTGGHIYPALAVARRLLERVPQARVTYVGTRDGLEASLIPGSGIEFFGIQAGGLARKAPAEAARGLWKMGAGLVQAARLLRWLRPAVVLGTGGYASAPVVAAAAWQGIPTLLHEQNASPGWANRFLARWADLVAVPFPGADRAFGPRARTLVTGNPVRPEILSATREEGTARLGLDPARPTLLVMGGSRGAERVNLAVAQALPAFSDPGSVQVVWVTGSRYFPAMVARLREAGIGPVEAGGEGSARAGPALVFSFLEEIWWALAAADLVVARAGGITIAEITARGLPAVLVPSPHVAGPHQRENAAVLGEAGAAVVVDDAEFDGPFLVRLVGEILGDEPRRRRMSEASRALGRPDATDRLVDALLDLAGGRE